MNHSLYQDGILKALPFKRLPWVERAGKANGGIHTKTCGGCACGGIIADDQVG